MKKFFAFAVLTVFFGAAFAQTNVHDGGIAPDFKLYQINKETGEMILDDTIQLYKWTDQGKPVFMDVFAVWCGPCWNYHHSGAFENLYKQYGPEGTDEVRVFGIECDGTLDQLYGRTSGTKGNWLEGTVYPLIPLSIAPNDSDVTYQSGTGTYKENFFTHDYGIYEYPTILMVCPSRRSFNVSQLSTDGLYKSIAKKCPNFARIENNATIFKVSGQGRLYYCKASIEPTLTIQNVGTSKVKSLTYDVTLDGKTESYSWKGSVEEYDLKEIVLPEITTEANGIHNVKITLKSVNGEVEIDTLKDSYSFSFEVQSEPSKELPSADFNKYDLPKGWTDLTGNFTFYKNAYCFNAYKLSHGKVGELYLPLTDISSAQIPVMTFDIAHARRNTTSKETLVIQYSSDCGKTWSNLYSKADPLLATATEQSDQYLFKASDWRTEKVSLDRIADKENVIIRFVFTAGGGNALYIDNIRVSDATAIEDFASNVAVYPNPASSVLNIQCDNGTENVEIFSLQGQLLQSENGDVKTMNIRNLAAGTYIIRITTSEGVINQKFVKE